MIPLYNQRIAVVVRNEQWSVSLVQFRLCGVLDSDVFLLTHCVNGTAVSELFHFARVARRRFSSVLNLYCKEYGHSYVVNQVEL
jgi:hypothetical protein